MGKWIFACQCHQLYNFKDFCNILNTLRWKLLIISYLYCVFRLLGMCKFVLGFQNSNIPFELDWNQEVITFWFQSSSRLRDTFLSNTQISRERRWGLGLKHSLRLNKTMPISKIKFKSPLWMAPLMKGQRSWRKLKNCEEKNR